MSKHSPGFAWANYLEVRFVCVIFEPPTSSWFAIVAAATAVVAGAVCEGWSEGTGLGSARSGMVEPISGSGQVRFASDLFFSCLSSEARRNQEDSHEMAACVCFSSGTLSGHLVSRARYRRVTREALTMWVVSFSCRLVCCCRHSSRAASMLECRQLPKLQPPPVDADDVAVAKLPCSCKHFNPFHVHLSLETFPRGRW